MDIIHCAYVVLHDTFSPIRLYIDREMNYLKSKLVQEQDEM